MTSRDGTEKTGGRPRSAASRAAILRATFDATFDLLASSGYAALTIEALAAASGTGKSTIYRWWPGKAELAVEAFFQGTEAALRLPATGLARDDFRAQIVDLARLLAGPRGAVMAAALASGEVRKGVLPETALALLYSPVYTPLLFGQPVPTETALEAIRALALDAVFIRPEAP